VSQEDNGGEFSRLKILAVLLAYVVEANQKIPVEQKAGFLTLFQKHVSSGQMSKNGLQNLVSHAFDTARAVPLDEFIEHSKPNLTHGQRLSVIANLLDMMLIDGTYSDGELAVIEKCREAFGVEEATVNHLRKVFDLKNDTTMFLDATHRFNDPGFTL